MNGGGRRVAGMARTLLGARGALAVGVGAVAAGAGAGAYEYFSNAVCVGHSSHLLKCKTKVTADSGL